MAWLLPSLFVLLLHFCVGQVEDTDASEYCADVGADGTCSGGADRVSLFQDKRVGLHHAKQLQKEESALEKAAANRHSSLKAAMKTQTACQTPPAFLAGVACPEGQVCTYKETRRNETFTAEKSGSFVKVILGGRSLYMSEELLITDSPCDGMTLKANILEPAVLEGHSLTCTDHVLRDVSSDAVFSYVASGDGGVDLVDVGNDGTLYMDHLEFSGSAPGEGFTVPIGSVTEVTRSELFEHFSGDCSSSEVVSALDRALNKKGIATMIFGGLMIAGGFALCAACIPCCFVSGPIVAFGASVLAAGITQEVVYRVNARNGYRR